MTTIAPVPTTKDVASIDAAPLCGFSKAPAAGDLASVTIVSTNALLLAAATRAAGCRAPHTSSAGEHHADGGAL